MKKILGFVLPWFGLIAQVTAEEKVNLSPALWPKGELERYTAIETPFPAPFVHGEAEKAMIVSSSHVNFAVRSGLEALKQGGSAVDAILVTALTQIALNLGSWSSYGGALDMVIFEAETGKVYTLNGSFNTVLNETDPLSIPTKTPSGRAVMVPGFMASVEAAHRRFGKLPFEQLFAPAIYFAENGFALKDQHIFMIKNREKILTRLPETRAIFFKRDGAHYKHGELFKQPALASTLRRVAAEGSAYMYRGEWAKKLVDLVQAEGGKLTMADLAAYQPTLAGSLKGSFRDYVIHTMPPPNFASSSAILAFHLMDLEDPAKLGDYREKPEALYRMIQYARAGPMLTVAPARTGYDPTLLFGELDVSLAAMAKPETASAILARIKAPDWNDKVRAVIGEAAKRMEHSDSLAATDPDGNMVAMIHSINTLAWGTGGFFVDGVSVADSGGGNRFYIQKVGFGKRLYDGTNPLIITRNAKPVLASSATGRGLHETSIQNIYNLLGLGLSPVESLASPKFMTPSYHPKDSSHPNYYKQLILEGSFSPQMIAALKILGQDVDIQPKNQYAGRGYWTGLWIDPKTGKRHGMVSAIVDGAVEGF